VVILGPDEAMRAVVSGGARQLLDAAGRRVGEILTERALLAPDTADEARAWAAVADLCEAEDRRRVGEGQDAWGPDVRERITQRTIDEIFGMGPMQEACRMPDAIQVEAQAPDEGWVLLDGDRLARIPLDFASPDAMAAFIRRKAEQAGHRVDDASPAVDFAIPGGRFHAVVAPVARGLGWSCPIITIRLQRLAQPDLATLEAAGTFSAAGRHMLAAMVHARCNIVVSGGSGDGKTTLIQGLLSEIPYGEKVIVIEELTELRLPTGHRRWGTLEGRRANVEGKGEISLRYLVREAMRQGADRIILGEARGPEARDVVHAMNCGAEGSLSSLHANSPRDALEKLESYCTQGEDSWSPDGARRMIGHAVDVVVQMGRAPDRRRIVEAISEVERVVGSDIMLNDLFRADASGELRWCGIVPGGRKAEALRRLGWSPLREVTQ